MIERLTLLAWGDISSAGRHDVTIGRTCQRYFADFGPLRHARGIIPGFPQIQTRAKESFLTAVCGTSVARFHELGDFTGCCIAIHEVGIPLIPSAAMRIRRDRFGSPCLTVVDAATTQLSFDTTQHLSVSQIGQRHSQQMPRMGWFVGQNGLRLTPTCAMVVARQHHRAMGVVTTHEHQQPVFLRHVNDVRYGDDAIPILGDDLQLRRHANTVGLFGQLPNFVGFPLIRIG